ncbi:MAG: hypothetical protein IJZ16_04655 [Clostridia bacterium]|nr:hypothetical protein [Clostridia bacterium]
MSECKNCVDEICVNTDCPLRADYCPVPNDPDVCKWEERDTTISSCKECIHYEVCSRKQWHISENKYMYQMENVKGQCTFFKTKSDFQEVKHGKWISTGIETMFLREFKCNRCKYKILGNTSYCPNCGALMDGKTND